jgi:hypothetical protein
MAVTEALFLMALLELSLYFNLALNLSMDLANFAKLSLLTSNCYIDLV